MATGKTIRITGTGANGRTPVGINGRHRWLPHNKDVAVSDAEISVLENSRIKFEVVKDSAKSAELKGAVDQAPGNNTGAVDGSETPAGADNLTTVPPVVPVPLRVTPPVNETPAGADNLSSNEPGDIEAARVHAEEVAAANAEGTTEPVVVLTNNDPDQTGSVATEASLAAAEEGQDLNRSPFSAATTLEQPIAKITEDMDEFTPRQLKALRTAEENGKARVGVIRAIDKKLAE